MYGIKSLFSVSASPGYLPRLKKVPREGTLKPAEPQKGSALDGGVHIWEELARDENGSNSSKAVFPETF